MTDNAWAYRATEYRAALAGRRQTRTRPYRPQTNGKAERFIGTLVREWAYARTYTTNAARLAALPAFVDFYNRRRPHTALGGANPAAVVNNVHGDHTWGRDNDPPRKPKVKSARLLATLQTV